MIRRRLRMRAPRPSRLMGSRGDRLRLSAMTLLLLLVLAMIQSVSRLNQSHQAKSAREISQKIPAENRIQMPERLPPGMVAVALQEKQKNEEPPPLRDPGPEAAERFYENFPPPPPLAEPIFEPGPIEPDAWVLPPALLAEIEDNRVGALRKEYPFLTAVLDIVRPTPVGELEQHGQSDVLHAVLMQQPDLYRGHLISLKGALHQLAKVSAAHELDLFEAWLSTEDSGANMYRVLITECEGVTPETKLPVDVTVTAYFLKRYAYQPREETSIQVAPMLIGKTLKKLVVPQPNRDYANLSRRLWMSAIVGGSVIVLTFALWVAWTSRHDRRRLTFRSSELTFEPPIVAVDEPSPQQKAEGAPPEAGSRDADVVSPQQSKIESSSIESSEQTDFF